MRILYSLHWLPVSFKIDFKILVLVYKALGGLGLSYLSDVLLTHEPSETLRSSGSGLLIILTDKTKSTVRQPFINMDRASGTAFLKT